MSKARKESMKGDGDSQVGAWGGAAFPWGLG
jgi:hypothetical protein